MARASLSLPFAGLHGSLGSVSIVQRPDGPEVRPKSYRPRKPTPGQAAGAERLRRAGEAWRALDEPTYAAWAAFARSRSWRNPATGAIVVPQTFRLFSGLASKALQVEPGRSLAGFAPPARPFLGDGIVVSLEDAVAPLPLPPLGDEPLGEGVQTFASSGANAPGVVTEILGQPLVNARRAAYGDKYVSKGFVAFEGPESVAVPLGLGAWALAYRFVLAATGEETGLVPLGVVTVG